MVLTDKQRVNNLKQVPCADCGESRNPEAMDFDHVRGRKKGNVSQLLGTVPFHEVLAEIAKCEVVCAGCHRERTKERHQSKHRTPRIPERKRYEPPLRLV